MKRYSLKKWGVAAMVTTLSLQSCDSGFEEMNTNPNAATAPTVNYLFTKNQLDAIYQADRTYFFTSILNCGGFIQHFATYKEVSGVGDKYFATDLYQGNYYRVAYPISVNGVNELIRATSTSPKDVNKLAVARIWKAYIMHRITDLYGDVPYSDAAKGFTDNNFTPKYDAQAEIYRNMLQELEAAATSFDAAQPTFGSADLVYNGNIDQWKKFAYSLMLRLSMRLTNVDQGMAKQWAEKAIAGGVILNSADIARIKYTEGPQIINRNPVAFELRGQDYAVGANGVTNIEGGKFSKTLIDFLKDNHDPRLGAIAVVWKGSTPDTSAVAQKGLANGLNAQPSDFASYSEPNPQTILKYDAPVLIMTHSEMNLLLSEAAVRGWYNGNAATHFTNGIEASMNNWSLFGSAGVIQPSRIATYTLSHPLNTLGSQANQLEQIHTQMWVALLLDEQEAYANWRRTGYPVLVPVNYPGNASQGTIPRRFPYSQIEVGTNADNYNAAVGRQGSDQLNTRIWWDKN